VRRCRGGQGWGLGEEMRVRGLGGWLGGRAEEVAAAGVCPRLPALARLREVEAVLRVHARGEDVEVDAVRLLHDDHVRAHVQQASARVEAHRVRHGGVAAPEPATEDEDPSAAPNHLHERRGLGLGRGSG